MRTIFDLVNRKGYKYKDIAILMRLNALTRNFEEKFISYNIPYKIFGGLKFYERAEIKNVMAYFKLLVNPFDEESFLRIINFPKRGIGEVTVDKIVLSARDYNFRSSDVEHTYFLWSGVRKGEDRFIFPFKSNAQEFINTFHPFEPCLFRNEARELLSHITEESPYVDEAKRLSEALERLEYFDESLLTKDSLLREFIG